MAQDSASRHIPNRSAYICLPKNMYKNSHSNISHYTNKLETTQMSIPRRDKFVVCSSKGILRSSIEKEMLRALT